MHTLYNINLFTQWCNKGSNQLSNVSCPLLIPILSSGHPRPGSSLDSFLYLQLLRESAGKLDKASYLGIRSESSGLSWTRETLATIWDCAWTRTRSAWAKYSGITSWIIGSFLKKLNNGLFNCSRKYWACTGCVKIENVVTCLSLWSSGGSTGSGANNPDNQSSVTFESAKSSLSLRTYKKRKVACNHVKSYMYKNNRWLSLVDIKE